MEVIDFASNWGQCTKKRKLLFVILYGLLLSVWKVRNDKLFNNRFTSPSKMEDFIIRMVFKWVNFRGNLDICNWFNWVVCPFKIV